MEIHGTTIVAVRHNGKVVVAGDGQVTIDITVIKHGAKKVRRLYSQRSNRRICRGHCRRLYALRPV